jgi:hypothetical protein
LPLKKIVSKTLILIEIYGMLLLLMIYKPAGAGSLKHIICHQVYRST